MDFVRSLHLVANPRSGKGAGEALPELAKRICLEKNIRFCHHQTSETQSLDQIAEDAVNEAMKEGGVVVAAGGDGTIRSVAQHAFGKKVRFGVIPCGTFNFFARTHQLPEDHELAIRTAIEGNVKPVRLGRINEQVFLINASLGLYARAIKDRERSTKRFGRNRLVVILSSIWSFFEGRRRYLQVKLQTEKVESQFYTPMIFIGNNALQLRDLKMDVARCMRQNKLAIVLLKPVGFWDLLRIIYYGLLKLLEREDSIQSFCVDSMTIETRHPHKTVALDGELFAMTCPLEVQSVPESLMLMVPKEVQL